MGGKELRFIDKKLKSLKDLPLSPDVTSLYLSCNVIERIEGLSSAWHLCHLDLSSNCIKKIEGLSSLTSLKTLNLSSNLIRKVEGLNGLVNLTRLNLSYNRLNNLTGLLYLRGAEYKLKHLSLHGNEIESIDHLLQCLLGLQSLRDVTLSQDGADNPICSLSGYWETVMETLPQISVLDSLDRLRHPTSPGMSSLCDISGLEDYVDFLLSSDTSHNEAGNSVFATAHLDKNRQQAVSDVKNTNTVPVTQPVSQSSPPAEPTLSKGPDPINEERIRKLEHQVSQLIQQVPAADNPSVIIQPVVKFQKAKRDTDRTSESDVDSGKESKKRTRIPIYNVMTSSTTTQNKSIKIDNEHEHHKQKLLKSAVGGRRKTTTIKHGEVVGHTTKGPLRPTKTTDDVKAKFTPKEETYRTIVEERDQEMERRWKAEQVVRKLTEELKSLQMKFSEEKDLQSVALHTTDRLKELLLKERSGRSELQARVDELERRCQSLSQQLGQARNSEEQHKAAMLRLQESVSHGDALRACQQAEEMKRYQELENKAAALKRELDIQRVSVRQHKDKLQQLHKLLTSREEEHRKQLELRLQPGGADFQEAVAKEVAAAQKRHEQREADLLEKLSEGRRQYAALEDEFRLALTIEAARFSEVKEACDHMASELTAIKATLAQSQRKEKNSGSLVQELTAVVKEQKNQISELVRAKKDVVADLKKRLHSAETEVEQGRHLGLQLDVLQKEKAQLVSKLTAQESVIDGLRAERRVWSQELAQQGASLAQDRGRLEARIEALTTDLENQRKENERDRDALKIKTKIIDDQTETIRKLKESLLERDDQARRLKEEAVQTQKEFQQLLEEENTKQAELKGQLAHLSLRKEELKQQLGDKEAELEDVRRVYSDSSKKWQEKAELLTRLENQVKHMKESFDSKERLLLEEKNKATEAHKAAVEKLHCVDDAFRQQLETLQVSHQAELLQLANEKQEQIEKANQKIFEVEEEMRQLLEETETNKRMMEEKMRRLTDVLKEFNI